MQKITPFLWFENQAEEAANFYVSIFPNSRIVSTQRYGAAGPGPEGSVMLVAFELEGQGFHRAERRADLQVHAGGFVRHRLQKPGRGRSPLGEAHRRWSGATVRVADRSLRRHVAGGAGGAAAASRRSRQGEGEARDGSDVQDAQDRHRDIGARGVRLRQKEKPPARGEEPAASCAPLGWAAKCRKASSPGKLVHLES